MGPNDYFWDYSAVLKLRLKRQVSPKADTPLLPVQPFRPQNGLVPAVQALALAAQNLPLVHVIESIARRRAASNSEKPSLGTFELQTFGV